LRTAPSNWFFGSVDNVAEWNRILTWTEIQSIMTNGVPAPSGPVLPTIPVQPVSKTNNVFAGDTVSFTLGASGADPLGYQWRRNGTNIPVLVNSTATNNVLVLSNVQVADSGSTFACVVSNYAGSVTSSVASLTVAAYTPITNGPVLNLDFGLTDSPNLQPGFTEMVLGMSGTNFGGVGVTISPIGGALSDRNRQTVPVNNPPNLTQAQIYQDFIFQSSTTDGTGIRFLIERLAPNTQYGLTMWCWDNSNPNPRIADWIETASGSNVVIKTGFTWESGIPPIFDYDDTFGALLTSSPTGKLQIEGRKNSPNGVSVFVNALRLVAQPQIQITSAQLAGANIRITVAAQYSGQAISFQQRSDLVTDTWVTVTNGIPVSTHGPIVTTDFPVGTSQLFFRAVGQ
jgi:hypothetical protein